MKKYSRSDATGRAMKRPNFLSHLRRTDKVSRQKRQCKNNFKNLFQRHCSIFLDWRTLQAGSQERVCRPPSPLVAPVHAPTPVKVDKKRQQHVCCQGMWVKKHQSLHVFKRILCLYTAPVHKLFRFLRMCRNQKWDLTPHPPSARLRSENYFSMSALHLERGQAI